MTRIRSSSREFAGEVAARYGDRVDRYILWNEPNLGGWLRPQASCSGTAARRSRRTSTARSSAPPTRRSTPPTAARRS